MNPIRVIKREDIDRVLHIYKPYILETASTFELEPPELGVFRERVLKTLENYPWLVFEEQGIIKGYCYAGPHRSRPAPNPKQSWPLLDCRDRIAARRLPRRALASPGQD